MIEVRSIKHSDPDKFSTELQELLNDGWKVTWQGVGANGSHYSSIYIFATLTRKAPPRVTKIVEPPQT